MLWVDRAIAAGVILVEESPDSKQAGYLGRAINQGGCKPMESATENNRRYRKISVRVKKCGKSAQLGVAIRLGGKPYPEQDKIGALGCLFPITRGYVA
jgi:hypothetical protein